MSGRSLRALVLSVAGLGLGCATPWGAGSPDAFDSSVQAELLRKQQEARAATAMPIQDLRPETLEERLAEGDARRETGAYADAMWHYLKAHELDPQHPGPVARIGSLHLASQPERAERIFLDLVETHPDSGAAYTGLGLVRLGRQDWAGAHTVLTEAVERSPRSAQAQSALGVCLDRLGEPTAAREAYARAVALHPDFYEALNNLGVSYLTTGDYAKAAGALGRASRQQERDPAVFNNLGLALGRLDRYDDALDAFRKAGDEQAARNNLGYVAFLNGDYDRAILEYEQALLARGDQRLAVLRNLRAAKEAQTADAAPAD